MERQWSRLTKIRFKLVPDEDGYPPFSSENIGCVRLDARRFRVDNIPFFVYGVSFADIVSAGESKDGLSFQQLLEEGGHSTLRVIFLDNPKDARPAKIRANELGKILERAGCGFQVSPAPEMLAIDVPPSVAIDVVRRILSEGEDAGLWCHDEGTVAHEE